MKGIVAIVMAAVLMPVPATAQEWKTYNYPDPGFAVQFPADPVVAKSTVRTANYNSLPMTRYIVRQEGITCTVSVVDYSTTNADALSTIAETERSIGATGKVIVATGARVNRSFGRELSLSGTDGSRSAVAIFFVNKHLYTVVGQALPPNAIERSGDAVRFQESLQFLGDNGGFGSLFFFGRNGGGGGGVVLVVVVVVAVAALVVVVEVAAARVAMALALVAAAVLVAPAATSQVVAAPAAVAVADSEAASTRRLRPHA